MIKKLLYLEWKEFTRSASFKTNLLLKIITGIFAFYLIILFLLLGFGSFYMLKDMGFEPLSTVNKYLIYYLQIDLIIRLFFQKSPALKIRPLLVLQINKTKIVYFCLLKTVISFFNIIHLFFFLLFSVTLLIEGYNFISVSLWCLGIVSLLNINNILNIIISNNQKINIVFKLSLLIFGGLHYFDFFDITIFSAPFFELLFQVRWMFVFLLLTVAYLYYYSFQYYKKELYLDTSLYLKENSIVVENFSWLDRFGKLSKFLKNDIKLITRNKRSKMTLLMSFLFLFYGLFISLNLDSAFFPRIIIGMIVSGGFLSFFGQFVPSWDSSYYPLMMTQNIYYREYLESKWWLIIIATFISTLLASFYLFIDIEIYKNVLAGSIYNMGINSYLVLYGGAYNKTPIDLESSTNAYAKKSNFNLKLFLHSLPRIFLPILLFWSGSALMNDNLGYIFVAVAGILGFAFRNFFLSKIEKTYKSEKHHTLLAYKQK